MSNFIKEYILRLRASDEKTRHRSALTISIILSVIILSIAFVFLKDIFFFSNSNSKNIKSEEVVTSEEIGKIESPLTSFANFFRDSAEQISKSSAFFKDIPEAIKRIGSDSSQATSTDISTSTDTLE